MHALVVDDSRATRMILRQFLGKLGFAVAEAADGRAGLEALGQETDVVLVDWNMPDMDGLAFVRALRARSGAGGPPVILVTSEEDAARVEAAREAGASAYLRKPFTRETLLDQLGQAGISLE